MSQYVRRQTGRLWTAVAGWTEMMTQEPWVPAPALSQSSMWPLSKFPLHLLFLLYKLRRLNDGWTVFEAVFPSLTFEQSFYSIVFAWEIENPGQDAPQWPSDLRSCRPPFPWGNSVCHVSLLLLVTIFSSCMQCIWRSCGKQEWLRGETIFSVWVSECQGRSFLSRGFSSCWVVVSEIQQYCSF